MLFPVDQAFVGRDEKRAPLKMLAWKASQSPDSSSLVRNRVVRKLECDNNSGSTAAAKILALFREDFDLSPR